MSPGVSTAAFVSTPEKVMAPSGLASVPGAVVLVQDMAASEAPAMVRRTEAVMESIWTVVFRMVRLVFLP